MTGKELKKIRGRLGWNKAYLASALGVRLSTVGKLERGEVPIKETMARQILSILEMETEKKKEEI